MVSPSNSSQQQLHYHAKLSIFGKLSSATYTTRRNDPDWIIRRPNRNSPGAPSYLECLITLELMQSLYYLPSFDFLVPS